MIFYKSAAFWITVAILGIVGGLAFLGKVGGTEALGYLAGVGSGWGISKAGKVQ